MRTFQLILTACVLTLAGCQGGGGSSASGGSSGSSTSTGVFLDARVEGLDYQSGSASGVTDAQGRFEYDNGSDVTFSIGAVTLGSARGQDVVMPLHLVADGTATTPEVVNIVRFLMMLDADGDATNGIRISSDVRSLASGWPSVDFSVATSSFGSDVTRIQSDLTSLGEPSTLPSVSAAQSHLRSTFYCANIGAYQGTYSGDSSGQWMLAVNGHNGKVAGGGEDTAHGTLFALAGSLTATADQSFEVTRQDASSATFSGIIGDDGDVSGTWEDPDTGESGTLTGSALTTSLPAGASGDVYKGIFVGDDFGPVRVAIATNGSVTGRGYSALEEQDFSISGNQTSGELTGTTSLGSSFTATEQSDGSFVGTWSNGANGGAFIACPAVDPSS